MKVLVQRGSGLNISPDSLTNPLHLSYNVCTARGQNYLYEMGFDKFYYNISMPYRTPVVCGKTVQVDDFVLGEVFRGRITKWNVTVTTDEDGSVEITKDIEIERSIT